MAKRFLEVSEEERKVLEGTESGKALLKKLEVAEEASASLEKAKLDAETRLSSTEKARKDLEDSLLNPDILEAMASRRKPEAKAESEEDLDSLPPSKLAARMRKEVEDRVTSVVKELKQENFNLRKGISAALNQLQLDALEDKHGEKFSSRKEKLAEFATKSEYQALRPRDVYAKFCDLEELEGKRKAEAEAKALESARQKEIESYVENPETSIAPGAAGEKSKPATDDEAFDRAWKGTPGADKLLRQE